MKYLLDTCTYIWLLNDSEKLSSKAKSLIFNEKNDLALSVVSLWEFGIKVKIGKIELGPNSIHDIFFQLPKEKGITLLPLEPEHVAHFFHLKPRHKDPFDQMLVAQSVSKDMAIITPDHEIKLYDVSTIW